MGGNGDAEELVRFRHGRSARRSIRPSDALTTAAEGRWIRQVVGRLAGRDVSTLFLRPHHYGGIDVDSSGARSLTHPPSIPRLTTQGKGWRVGLLTPKGRLPSSRKRGAILRTPASEVDTRLRHNDGVPYAVAIQLFKC